MKRSARRTILRVIVLLIAGATLNVAVAWGCSFLDLNETTSFGRIDKSDNPWWVGITERPGAVRIVSGPADPQQPEPSLEMDSEELLARTPRWSRVYGPRYTAFDYNYHIRKSQAVYGWEYGRGWPFLALRCSFDQESYAIKHHPTLMATITDTLVVFESSRTGDPVVTRTLAPGDCVQDGILVRRASRSVDVAILPLRPIWPGFAVNTLFYAGVLWVLFCGPFALRRMIRRRRGHCPHCAYPIGQSPVCTECGAAVMKTSGHQGNK